jgi:hypothetical protein
MQSSTNNRNGIRTIIAGVLPDGSVVDLVASTQPDIARLVVYNGVEVKTGNQFEVGATLYRSPKLPEALQRVVLPAVIAEYGTISILILALVKAIRGCIQIPNPVAITIAFWVLSTWMSDCFWSPPTLVVTGSPERAMILFRLLRLLCRRGIMLTRFSTGLPLKFQLTLMLVDPTIPKRTASTWRVGNFRDVHVPNGKGELLQIVCSKAIYVPESAVEDSWREDALCISVPAFAQPPSFDTAALDSLAALFQPQLQLYRLHRLYELVNQQGKDQPPVIPRYAMSGALIALSGGERQAEELLAPVLEEEREAESIRRTVDVSAVAVEALWNPAHEQKSLAVSEVCKRVNTILRARGETLAYNPLEIGWKLRNLDLPRDRNAGYKFIKFNQPVRERIHELANEFGLQLLRLENCKECEVKDLKRV